MSRPPQDSGSSVAITVRLQEPNRGPRSFDFRRRTRLKLLDSYPLEMIGRTQHLSSQTGYSQRQVLTENTALIEHNGCRGYPKFWLMIDGDLAYIITPETSKLLYP